MTDVNKNIIDAYKSMYEPKEEVLDETNKNDKSDDGDGLETQFNLMQSKRNSKTVKIKISTMTVM